MTEVAITDVCDFQGGTQPPKNQWSPVELPDYVRMLQIRDFTQAKDSHIEYVKDSSTLKKCNAEDILIGRYGASIGKILTGLAGAYNVAIVKTIPDLSKLDRSFLLHLLKGESFQRFIQNVGSRAAQAGFNKKELTLFRFNLPPLAEQQKIAAILDAADALRQKDQQLIEHYSALSQSLFLDMFGDPVSNTMKWKVDILGNLTTKIGSGATPRGGKEAYISHGISLIRSLNVHDNQFVYKDLAHINEQQAKALSNVVVVEDDVLLNITGASVCRAAMVPREILPARVNQHVCIIRARKELIYPSFLLNLLLSGQYKSKLLITAGAGGATREALTKSQVENLVVVLPPIELQNQFAERIEIIEQQKQQVKASLEKSEALFNSLLQRAFTGELTGSKAA